MPKPTPSASPSPALSADELMACIKARDQLLVKMKEVLSLAVTRIYALEQQVGIRRQSSARPWLYEGVANVNGFGPDAFQVRLDMVRNYLNAE